MGRLINLCLILFLLVGCSNATLQKELEDTQKELLEKETLLNEAMAQITCGFEASVNFEKTMTLETTILQKYKGNQMYPYHVIVSIGDDENNTPLLLVTNSKDKFDTLTVGETITLHVLTEFIYDHEDILRVKFVIV